METFNSTAIRKCDFFVVCLSRHSFSKRGFLQKEIRVALDVRDELLDSDIYLIPVRLEDCEVPSNLSDLQWIDLFEADGWIKLTTSFEEGVTRRSEPADYSVLESSPDHSAPPKSGRLTQDRIDLQPDTFVRIAVSGDVPLTKLEKEIVGTADFQRLRRIKQLGTAYLVYPSAVHTKFDHSLGTLAVAARMIQSIRENPQNSADEGQISAEEEQLIRLFALVHAITDMPFGYILETSGIVESGKRDQARIERYLGGRSEIGRIIIDRVGLNSYHRLLRIHNAESIREELGKDSYIHDIVCGPLCADLLDTLHRDLYFCNPGLNVDSGRILHYLFINDDGQCRRLVLRLWTKGRDSVRRDVLGDFIHLVQTQYLLAERVLFHRTKLAADAMLTASVLREVLTQSLDQKEFWDMGDEGLLDRLCASKSGTVRRLATDISKQFVWEEAARLSYELLHANHSETHFNQLRSVVEFLCRHVERRKSAESSLSRHYRLADGDLLLYCLPPTMSLRLLSTNVLWNEAVGELSQCVNDSITMTTLQMLGEMYRNLWSLYVFINPIHGEISFDNIGKAILSLVNDEPT